MHHAFRLLIICLAAAAFAVASARTSSASSWTPPVAAPHVISGFDPPDEPWLAGHRGIDLAAGRGTPVLAAGSGIVTFAGSVAGKPVIVVEHGELRTTYEPAVASLAVGTEVDSGDVIGAVSAGGHCASSCLHFGLLRGDEYLNPLLAFGGPPRLKPVSDEPGSETEAPSLSNAQVVPLPAAGAGAAVLGAGALMARRRRVKK